MRFLKENIETYIFIFFYYFYDTYYRPLFQV